ncbi:hypothetical protein [Geoalkalibacter sp.]|uniref:hypothetical protein n=1 Tax=Geoalkalibacter sp. TaxID=3041440 RepID=UPI00272E4534|nr:hypothetical protein [Geoalkalibacter sp.]
MTMKSRGFHYLRTGLTLLLGAGATLGSSFVISRLREKQDAESRMERLEQMLDDLEETKGGAPARATGATEPVKAAATARAKTSRSRRTEK